MLQSRTVDETQVSAVAVSTDSRQLASGAVLKLWDLPDLASFHALSPVSGATSLAFSPDGQLLAVGIGTNDNAVRIYAVDGTFLRGLPFSSWVTAVAFSPDSRLLAVGNRAGIQIYRTSDWQFDRIILVNGTSALAFSPDGETLASADRTTKLWHTSDGTLLRELDGAGPLAFSSDGQVLLTTVDRIRFWNVSDGSLLRMYDRGGLIFSVAFSPDDSVFAYAQLPGNVVVAQNPLTR